LAAGFNYQMKNESPFAAKDCAYNVLMQTGRNFYTHKSNMKLFIDRNN